MKPSLKIEFTKYYKLAITTNDPGILESFKRYLFTWEYKTYYITKRNGERMRREDKIESKMYTMLGPVMMADAGLLDYIAVHVSNLYKMMNGNIDFSMDLPKLSKLELTDKWRDIFAGHPRGYGNIQTAIFNKLSSNFGGTVEIFTGAGKSEALLSLAEISAEAGNRVAILAPDNAIRDELLLRGKRWNVDINHYQWDKLINVICPKGFLASKESSKSEAREWLAGVKLVLTDESHHLQANSWETLFNCMPEVERSYGFSASIDTSEGNRMSPGSVNINDLGVKTSKIIGLSGVVKMKESLPIPVSLLRLSTTIAPKGVMDNTEFWMDAFDFTTTNIKLAEIISNEVLLKNPERIFFIPIYRKESGFKLYENLLSLGHTGIYWTGDGLWIDGEQLFVPNKLEVIKEKMSRDPSRFFISTVFEGIDIPGLDGIIPLVGTSYRMTIQPVGRSARRKDVLAVLIYDRNNPIVLSQSKKRRDRITKEYNLVSDNNKNV